MDNERIALIKKKLVKKLPPARYEHTLGVAYTAAALAMRYGTDMEQAFMAGLLHDCAKHLSDEKMLEKCVEFGLPVSDDERKKTILLHAKLGAYYAEHKYGVQDAAICHAIACHTTGCQNMSLLDMILYTADYIEPNRDKAPNLSYYRKLAFEDIGRCTYEILEGTISYLTKCCAPLDKTTLEACEGMKIYAVKNNGKED